jgi:predicted nucleic acid-binding protein
MGIMMTVAKAFVDTNVLLRALHSDFTLHQAAKGLIDRYWDQGYVLWINRQVVREYLVQVTHPATFVQSLTYEQIARQIGVIRALFKIPDETDAITQRLMTLLQTYPARGKLIHDANLVAVMLEHDIDTLLTLNTADFQRFVPLITLVTVEG